MEEMITEGDVLWAMDIGERRARGVGVECVSPDSAVIDVHLVKNKNKKERREWAALFNSLLNCDRCCDVTRAVGIHTKSGALEGIAHKVNKLWGEAEASKGPENAGPCQIVIGLRNVIEYGV